MPQQPTSPPIPGGPLLLRRPLLWQQAMDRLAEAIRSGLLPPGATVPAEAKLAAEFGVSVPVVRNALAGLRAAGMVTTHVGKGTFIAEDWDASRCPACGADTCRADEPPVDAGEG